MSHDEPTWSAPSPSQPWSPAEQLFPTPPPAPPPRTPAAPGPRGPRGRRFWWLTAAVVVLAVAVAVTVAVWPRGDRTPPAAGVTGSPTGSSSTPRGVATAPLTAVDRTVVQARVGDCVGVRDALDDVVPATAAVADCTDPAATFSVVSVNRKAGAEQPCRGDSALESTNVDRVLCLRRVYQAGQCVLGNGARQFLASAVGCDEVPQAPFTQVFTIDAVSAQGVAATCTPPAVAVPTSANRGVCLRQVR